MKQIRVKFKTPNGNICEHGVNTSGSEKSAVKSLAKTLPKSWEVVSHKVVKEW